MSNEQEKGIPSTTKNNFATLQRAFSNGDVALLRAKRVSDGKDVSLICACRVDEEGGYEFTPFAMMLAEDGNPYEQFIPPPKD